MASDRSEDQLIAWLQRRLQAAGCPPLIGDDAALLDPTGPLAVTTDTQIEGVHFLPGTDPWVLARRLLAVNLSDLAAVGAEPTWVFLALSAPEGFDAKRFFNALIETCQDHDVSLAGGDLSRQSTLTLVLTAVGTQRPGSRWLRRDGARPGHNLWVGGTVGEAALGLALQQRGARIEVDGDTPEVVLPDAWETPPSLRPAARQAVLRHLLPTAQLPLGAWLSQTSEGAGLDLSDGLALDLHRLLEASQAGAQVEAERLPLAPAAPALAEALGLDPLALAFGGGEDYVLLFTLPQGHKPPSHLGAHRIGTILPAQDGVVLRTSQGSQPLPPKGWDHLR